MMTIAAVAKGSLADRGGRWNLGNFWTQLLLLRSTLPDGFKMAEVNALQRCFY